MSLTAFKSLTAALTQSTDWAPIDRAWQETEGLTEALRAHIPAALFAQVTQVRRGDPSRGIRGSLLTVVAKNSAAAAKLRLALSDWDQTLRAAGWGIQQIKVVEARQQPLGTTPQPTVKRDPIPAQAKTAFGALAQEMPNQALKSALSRLAKRG
ncbi:hypothetical protein AOB54_09215 [beta proteobacterium MWH-UniP1]